MTGRFTSRAGLLLALGLLATCAMAAVEEAEPRGQVLLPSGHVLMVEIADTPREISRGYMFREKISDDEGMVFLLGRLGFHSFWMKNCKVSLDITWLDENWQVVHQELGVPPCEADPCRSYIPMKASMYVLEVRAGLARREGLLPGSRVVYLPPSKSDSNENSDH